MGQSRVEQPVLAIYRASRLEEEREK